MQEDTIMMGMEPQRSAFAREIMCDAVFWNLVPNAIDWYTTMCKSERLVMIRLKEVLITGVTMKMIRENNMLPNKCNRKQTTNQKAVKIDDDDIREITEVFYRRDKFDKEFDIGI